MASENWVLVEHHEGKVKGAGELVGAARALGGAAVVGVLLAAEAGPLVEQLGGLGLSRVLVAEHPQLGRYTPDGYARVLEQLVSARTPQTLLFGHTPTGYDVAPKLAVRLDRPLVSEVTKLSLADGALTAERPLFGGKLVSRVRTKGQPTWLVTVQGGAYPAVAGEGGAPPVEAVPVDLDPAAIRWQLQPFRTQAKGAIDLAEASVVVSGGRGLGDADAFREVIGELVEAIPGAAMGASRSRGGRSQFPVVLGAAVRPARRARFEILGE